MAWELRDSARALHSPRDVSSAERDPIAAASYAMDAIPLSTDAATEPAEYRAPLGIGVDMETTSSVGLPDTPQTMTPGGTPGARTPGAGLTPGAGGGFSLGPFSHPRTGLLGSAYGYGYGYGMANPSGDDLLRTGSQSSAGTGGVGIDAFSDVGLSSVSSKAGLYSPSRHPLGESRAGGKGSWGEKFWSHANAYVIRSSLLASISSALLGYDIGITSGALLFIAQNFGLSHFQQEFFVGILNLVSLVGALAAGRLADAVGRRMALLASSLTFFSGALCMALAPSYPLLLLGRIVTGIGIGFGLSVPPLYIAEIAPVGNRGGLVSLGEVFINLGILLGFLTSFVLGWACPEWLSWRLMLGGGAALAVLLGVSVGSLPESPRWLIMQGRVGEGEAVLLCTSSDELEAHRRYWEILDAAGLADVAAAASGGGGGGGADVAGAGQGTATSEGPEVHLLRTPSPAFKASPGAGLPTAGIELAGISHAHHLSAQGSHGDPNPRSREARHQNGNSIANHAATNPEASENHSPSNPHSHASILSSPPLETDTTPSLVSNLPSSVAPEPSAVPGAAQGPPPGSGLSTPIQAPPLASRPGAGVNSHALELPQSGSQLLGGARVQAMAGADGQDVWKEILWPSPAVARMLVVLVGVNFFQQATGIDATVYYSPVTFRQAGLSTNPQLLGATVVVGCVKVFFVLVAVVLLDHYGRRPLLLVSVAGMMMALLAQGTGFSLLQQHNNAFGPPPFGWPAVLAVLANCTYVAFFSIGMGPINWLLTSEIFPLRLRAQAIGLGTAMNRVVSGAVAMTFLSLVDATGTSGPFFIFAGMCLLALGFFHRYAPETRGRSLEEIVKMFERADYARAPDEYRQAPGGLARLDGNLEHNMSDMSSVSNY